MKKSLSIVLAAALTSLLLACGGGGGNVGTLQPGTTIESSKAASFSFTINTAPAEPGATYEFEQTSWVAPVVIQVAVKALDGNRNGKGNVDVTVTPGAFGSFVLTAGNRTDESGVYTGTVEFLPTPLATFPIETSITVSVKGAGTQTQLIRISAPPATP